MKVLCPACFRMVKMNDRGILQKHWSRDGRTGCHRSQTMLSHIERSRGRQFAKTRCVCGKRSHATQQEAFEAAKKALIAQLVSGTVGPTGRKVGYYKCKKAEVWHVTTHHQSGEGFFLAFEDT